MGRDLTQIRKSMIKNVADTDPSIDVASGPVYDASIVPISSEISVAESRVDHLEQLYSTAYIKTATEEEVSVFANNFALGDAGGKRSKGIVFFISYKRPQPGETITAREGTLVADKTGDLIYQINTEVSMYGDYASSYYNSSKGWYEIATDIVAINSGDEYDLPPYRITTILDKIPGIDDVENRNSIKGGTPAETKERKFERIQNAFEGADSASIAGVRQIVEDYDPESIDDVVVVTASDRVLFQRSINKLAIDVYIVGEVSETVVDENFNILEVTNYVVPEFQPMLAVVSVSKNGVNVPQDQWQIEKDTGVLFDSTRAQDRVVFSSNLTLGDIITVTYTYNILLVNVQNDIFSPNEDELFEVDTLIRAAVVNYLDLSGKASISSSATEDEVLSNVISELYTLIETNKAGVTYSPEIIKQQLVDKITGLTDFKFDRFTTTTGSALVVETVQLARNSHARIDPDLLLITSR